MKEKPCIFRFSGIKVTFGSIQEANKEFGVGRKNLLFYMNHERLFYDRKGRIVIFEGWAK